MTEEHIEQGELTERFRAFAQSVDPAPNRTVRTALLAGGAIVVLLVLITIAILLIG